ncbi:I78 family peptidase inhibitor [Pseudooctadecabacter sp.]|uniref:I78 family peptidase inhibitor n=1 Tax=Pseudooctadecabacter sp. TaxID=1966338 RepID=UPI0025FD7060|nr:I78 family peptidase inhibitor [Pseudooctadecabacter sp.]
MRQSLIIALLLGLAACAAPVPPTPALPPVPAATDDTCNAGRHAGLVGQDATALERVLILAPVRLIRPGQAVTMDFRPDRINFTIGPDNRITSISCN